MPNSTSSWPDAPGLIQPGQIQTAELGVGLVYWPGLEHLFKAGDLGLTSLEVEAEAFWFQDQDPKQPLRLDDRAFERIAALPQAKVIHGIGGPLGSCRPPDARHLDAISESIDRLDARWYSEHLAFNRGTAAGRSFASGFLLPPLQTEAGAAAAADTIRTVQQRLGTRIAVETGVNYLQPRPGELDDGHFVRRVAELADCDLLLDLHNAWTNARNGRQSVDALLDQLDLTRVREVHLAGGFEYQGFWLDAHSGLVPEPVLDLARDLVPRLPRLCAIHIEILPQFIPNLDLDALRDQLRAVQAIWQTRGARCDPAADPGRPLPTPDPRTPPADCSPAQWEDTLAALVAGVETPLAEPWAAALARDPAIPLYLDLARTFRAGVIVEHLKMTSRYLMLTLPGDGFRRLLNAFWREHTPEPFTATECRAAAGWLGRHGPPLPHLQALLDYDLALIGVGADDQTRLVRFNCEPLGLLRALGEGRLPAEVEPGDFELALTAD